MKHFTKKITLVLMAVLIGFSSNAQNTLKKANKEFDLYAFNLALKSYRKVLEKDPLHVEALSRLADCYRHLNQMDEAANWYVKALDQEGVDPVNLFYYGEVLKAKGEYDKAKTYFDIYGEGQAFFGEHFSSSCDFANSMLGVPSLYRVKSEFMNTPSSEFGPAFYKDQVVFSSSRTDIARAMGDRGENWTGAAKNQLFISSTDGNGFLTVPVFLHNDLSNNYNEGPLSYSADGKLVAFTKNDFVEGTRQIPSSGMELSIYIAKVGANGDFYETKPFPYNGSGYSSGFPSLSADGKTMYFSSNRPDGLGGWDIYVSRRIGETWTTPENLGTVVNTAGNEISPYFDGNSLYFSSDWHHGLGGLDIFRGERSNKEWTKVYHLGNGVNSSRDDYGFIFKSDKNIGYFTSNRGSGKGKEDIYQVSKRTDQIAISVKDAAGNPMPGVNIDFSACNEPTFQTDENGIYSFQALGGLDCEAIISKAGYTSYALKVESSGARKNQDYDVVLAKEAEQLTGLVVNTSNNRAVSDVYVRAMDQESGDIMEAYSDVNGNYSLALRPNSVYVIRYSKAGFTDTHNRVKVGEESDKGLLGVLAFTPSTTSIDDATAQVDAGSSASKAGATPSLKTQGYSIQLAAVYGNEKINSDSYLPLNNLGNIYSKPDKGYTKLRLGIFEDRAEAESAKAAITAKGFTQIFIVAEKLDDIDAVKVFSYAEETPPAVEPATKPTEAPPEATPVAEKPETEEAKPVVTKNTTPPPTSGSETVSGNFKIRLATYKNTKFFNPSKIQSLGKVERVKKGELTIMILSAYDTLAEVNQVFDQVKSNGFPGAHIIVEKDGQWIRVR